MERSCLEQVIKWIPWRISGKVALFDPSSKISIENKRRRVLFVRDGEVNQESGCLKSKLYGENEGARVGLRMRKEFSGDLGRGDERKSLLGILEKVGKKRSTTLSPSKRMKLNYLNKGIFNSNERTAGYSIFIGPVHRKIALPVLRKYQNSNTPFPTRSHKIPAVKTIEINTDTVDENFWLANIHKM